MTCVSVEQFGYNPSPLSTASIIRFLEGEGQERQEDYNLTQMVDPFEFKESGHQECRLTLTDGGSSIPLIRSYHAFNRVWSDGHLL
jgi:hypothetical protein